MPESGSITLAVYNTLGQRIRTLVDGRQDAGYYTLQWDGLDEAGQPVSSGIYFYRLTAGEFSQTKRMVMMK